MDFLRRKVGELARVGGVDEDTAAGRIVNFAIAVVLVILVTLLVAVASGRIGFG